MIEIKHEDGKWNVYDNGHLVISYYSQAAAEAVKSMILDEREYEKSRREETNYARFGGAQ